MAECFQVLTHFVSPWSRHDEEGVLSDSRRQQARPSTRDRNKDTMKTPCLNAFMPQRQGDWAAEAWSPSLRLRTIPLWTAEVWTKNCCRSRTQCHGSLCVCGDVCPPPKAVSLQDEWGLQMLYSKCLRCDSMKNVILAVSGFSNLMLWVQEQALCHRQDLCIPSDFC